MLDALARELLLGSELHLGVASFQEGYPVRQFPYTGTGFGYLLGIRFDQFFLSRIYTGYFLTFLVRRVHFRHLGRRRDERGVER